jgi:hypothetical protein
MIWAGHGGCRRDTIVEGNIRGAGPVARGYLEPFCGCLDDYWFVHIHSHRQCISWRVSHRSHRSHCHLLPLERRLARRSWKGRTGDRSLAYNQHSSRTLPIRVQLDSLCKSTAPPRGIKMFTDRQDRLHAILFEGLTTCTRKASPTSHLGPSGMRCQTTFSLT